MYFGSIGQYAAISQSASVTYENQDNYQKQTYRNRMYIYGANGKLLLTIPIKHLGKGKRQLYRDVRIENDFEWQTLHWRSIETAYRTSPFFEYYEDELIHLFETKKEFLLDFNYECTEVIKDCLQLDLSFFKTSAFQIKPEGVTDFRDFVNAKKEKPYSLESYIQVFSDKYDFIPDLCILDLLFNEGTNALTYLEQQSIFI